MRLFLAIQLVFLFQAADAQDTTVRFRSYDKDEKSIDLWFAYNMQSRWSDEPGEKTLKYFEIGIGKGRYSYSRHAAAGVGIYLSEEILLNGDKRIYGTKLGCFIHSLLALGMSIIYYTDLEKGNLKIRPELGFGINRFAIVGGYNIPTIRNSSMPELQMQNAQVTFRAGLGVKKKEAKFDKLI